MTTYNIEKLLKENSYPGRGIIIGQSEDGAHAVAAYFIMGRSVNSRNRVFVGEGADVRTKAFDPSKMKDPSLIIYYPVRVYNNYMVVTNGDQADTIVGSLKSGNSFTSALKTRCFEPDAPNFTPRVSGIIKDCGGSFKYKLSILKAADDKGEGCNRYFFNYTPVSGIGHFIHTYKCDGNPIPSFEGEPERVEIKGGIDEFTNMLWDNLNEDNKVSLFVRYINLIEGTFETRIVNKNI